MDYNTLTRDKDSVLKSLKVTTNNGLICNKPVVLCIPSRFFQRELARTDKTTSIVGVIAVITEDNKYAVINAVCKLNFNNTTIKYITYKDTEYTHLVYEAGDILCDTMTIVKDSSMVFNIIDEFILKGKIPWYVEYDDLCKLLDTAKEYSGLNVVDLMPGEVLAQYITRQQSDMTKYHRSSPTTKYEYIGLRNMFYAASNTMAKISGSYFKDGVVSSLVTETKKISDIERMVRA